jgi:transposase
MGFWTRKSDVHARCREQIEALQAEILRLKEKIEQLEARLNQTSRNSSKPPSSDSTSASGRGRKESSGRKPGGQPGHEGKTRELLPSDQVDRIVPVKPETCQDCGAGLSGEDPNPRRHQVTETPPVRPHTTEYQLHTLVCFGCGAATKADLPEGVPTGAFGPRLQATAAILAGVYHLSHRMIESLMQDLFGVSMGLGSVSACERAVAEALSTPVVEAKAYVQGRSVKYADETGWREALGKAWLWVAATASVTVFQVHRRRGAIAAWALLGGVCGILVTDRWNAYNGWPVRLRQLCWAHLKRHFQAFSEWGGEIAKIGEALLEEVDRMFEGWHRVRDRTWARSTFQAHMSPLRRRVERLLEQGAACRHRKAAGMCREILVLKRALWTFVRVPGVEPTNNTSERAIRGAVIWRKISFGTHSERGSRFVERMLTVSVTLRQQGRNVLDYVTQACEATLRGNPIPSLVPGRTFVHARKIAV